MQKPHELDFVVCPKSGVNSKDTPEKVWDGAKGPDGKPRRYGIIGRHSHGYLGEECEYSGHVVPVEQREEKKKQVAWSVQEQSEWLHDRWLSESL